MKRRKDAVRVGAIHPLSMADCGFGDPQSRSSTEPIGHNQLALTVTGCNQFDPEPKGSARKRTKAHESIDGKRSWKYLSHTLMTVAHGEAARMT